MAARSFMGRASAMLMPLSGTVFAYATESVCRLRLRARRASEALSSGECVMRLIILALVLGLTACETVQTTKPGTVGIEREQRFLVSDQEINQAAAQEYRKVIADAQAKGKLDRNAQHVQRV